MTIDEELRYVTTSIRRIRNSKKISQLELSVKSGLSQSFLANVENGKKEPSTLTLIRIARALECNPRDFFPNHSKTEAFNENIKIKNEIISLLERL